MSNPLVAAPEQTSPYAGVPLLQDAADLSSALKSGDWASAAMGAVGTGMDALGAVMDPFGTILASGVGWLLEHVGPLKEALDALTGKPEQVTANAQTWQNVAKEFGGVGQDLAAAVEADLQSWSGEAADAYRARAADLANLLKAGEEAATGAGAGVKIAGMVVGAVRELVRGIIAEVIGRMISWALQVLFTAGIGLAWVVPQVVRTVAATATKITSVIGKLVKALGKLCPMLKRVGEILEKAAQAMKKMHAGPGGGHGTPRGGGGAGTPRGGGGAGGKRPHNKISGGGGGTPPAKAPKPSAGPSGTKPSSAPSHTPAPAPAPAPGPSTHQPAPAPAPAPSGTTPSGVTPSGSHGNPGPSSATNPSSAGSGGHAGPSSNTGTGTNTGTGGTAAPAPSGPVGSHTNPRPTTYKPPAAQPAPGKKPNIPASAHEHVTHGGYNANQNKPTGGHMWQGQVGTQPTNVQHYGHGVSNNPASGTNHYANGVYTQQNPSIQYGGGYGKINKPVPSTMFPSNLDVGQVQNLGNQAWNNGAPSGGIQGNKWFGHATLPNGNTIRIQGFANGGKVSSYFPSSQQ